MFCAALANNLIEIPSTHSCLLVIAIIRNARKIERTLLASLIDLPLAVVEVNRYLPRVTTTYPTPDTNLIIGQCIFYFHVTTLPELSTFGFMSSVRIFTVLVHSIYLLEHDYINLSCLPPPPP